MTEITRSCYEFKGYDMQALYADMAAVESAIIEAAQETPVPRRRIHQLLGTYFAARTQHEAAGEAQLRLIENTHLVSCHCMGLTSVPSECDAAMYVNKEIKLREEAEAEQP